MTPNQPIDSLTPSDKTRLYCRDHYVIPARVKGQKEVTIRSGDVHRELNFTNRLPLVCSSLGSKKFEDAVLDRGLASFKHAHKIK